MTTHFAKLKDVAKFINGKAYKPTDWSETGLPIIRIQNLNNKEKEFNYWNGTLDKQVLVEKSNLLFAWSGTPGTSFGAHIWSGERAVLNQHIFRVDLNSALITKNYAKLVINAKLNKLIEQAHGGVGLQHVTKGVVENLEIPLPPLAEQKSISEILDKAYEIKVKRELALVKLDDFEDSIFNEMFERQSNTQVSLKDICVFKYGKSLPSEKRVTGKFKVYGSNGVVGSHETAITEGKTIIVGRKGSYGEINFSYESCFPIDTTYFIDATATTQNLVWLAKALSKLGLNKMNKSAAVPGLSREDAYRQLVKLPSLKKQIEFEEITKKINHERDKLKQFLSESVALNHSLQNQAFTTGFNA